MHRPRHLLLVTALTLPLVGFGMGCTTNDTVVTPEQPRLGETRVSFSEDHFPPSFAERYEGTTGASGEAKKELPRDAFELADWRGRELTYEPEMPGFIYVFDQTDNRIVYSGHLHRGERFVLDRQRSRATINGEVAYAQDRDEARDYKVYFDRDD